MTFYSVPEDSKDKEHQHPTKYVAHWHKTNDQNINQDTYAEKGYDEVTRISVSRVENENYSLSEIKTPACTPQKITVKARTNRPEVTKPDLEWTSSDDAIAKVTKQAGNPLRADIETGHKIGEATITVTVSGSNVKKTFTVKNEDHITGESRVVKWGCTGPVRVSNTCLYCGKVTIDDIPNKHAFSTYNGRTRRCTVCGYEETYGGNEQEKIESAPAEEEKTQEETKQQTEQQPTETPEVSAPPASDKQTPASKPETQSSKPTPEKQTSAPKPAAQTSKPAALKANSITASNFTRSTSAKAQSFNIKAKTKGGARLTYTSNNKSVSVNGSGRVTTKPKFVGKATITINSAGTGEYKPAKKKITVTVNPPAVKLSSAKNLSGRKVQIKWKKNSLAGGYQVRYSTNKRFKSGVKTITATKNSKTSSTISKLKKGKTYYVQIRTYKKASGKNYYSAWSPVRSVKVKK